MTRPTNEELTDAFNQIADILERFESDFQITLAVRAVVRIALANDLQKAPVTSYVADAFDIEMRNWK